MNLDKLTMDELISLRNEIDGRIYNYTDGYLYICSVRQFGSVWEERPNSLYALKELCNSYYGDNGIVDVYTNNPNLEFPEMEFYNYGDVNYIKSEDDYREWVKYIKEKNFIKDVTERVNEWEKSKDEPLRYRPMFAPIWSKDQVDEFIKEFKSKTWDFTEPRSMKKNDFEDEYGVE
jgi:hypothetical protein